MNGISFHTARGQRITNVEFSRAQTQEEIDKSNEANRRAQDAATQDEYNKNQLQNRQGVAEDDQRVAEHHGIDTRRNDPTFKGSVSHDSKTARQKGSAPVTDEHPTEATDPSLKTAQLRFTLFGGEVVTVAADKLNFKGGAKGRPIDPATGLPTIQIGNDGALNKPGSHRVDQAASISDWLVCWFDWENDQIKWAVIDSPTLHTVTRRGPQ